MSVKTHRTEARRARAVLALAGAALAPLACAAGGLSGAYYDTATFGTLKTSRVDATVNFDWGTATPSGTALTSGDTFSVAWSGQLEPEFTELYTFTVTADDGARLWVNDQLVAQRTFYSAQEFRGQASLRAGERVNIRLEYVEQTGSAKIKLEWSSASRAREVIPEARLFPARVEKAGGALLKEHWCGLAGGTITSLTASANFPLKPSGRELVTTFECLAQDWTNAYGTRVTGHLVPPASGSYTFAVSGDDAVALYLSTDATTNNKALIASVTNATAFRDWAASPSQQSAPRALIQGQRYYVELLHKQSAGADHWSVGWLKPGDAGFSVIPGSALVQPGLTNAQPAESSLLNTLAQEHPRLFATPERFARLRAAWQSPASSQAKTWAQSAISGANTILTQDPVTYLQDVRGTILDQSRTAKDRLYKLGVAWQLTGDSQYAERAWEELSTVAAFPDWHPAHFLDTAEMTHACAIGYDWFHPYWTASRRATIRGAIITNGLNAGLSQYTSNSFWTQSTANNWNMVCNGGLTIGALALGAESESLAENILNRALNSTRPVWKHFTTDNGAWYEGPGYWGYTTEYGVRMLAALEWALGSDFGIGSTVNLSEAGLAPIYSLGPSGKIFNYADASAGGASRGPVFQWFARRYGQPLYAWWENQGGGGALDALWWDGQTASLADLGAQPDMAFHGQADTAFQPQEMVTLRGDWSGSRATFLGCKGGEMGAAHGNLDAGTFVLDALGKRWFHDLGGDNYALPGYFSSTPSSGIDRWDYYRMRPEGQNTLTINPSANADMTLSAVAPLIAYTSEPGGSGSFAIHDLTPVYSGMTRVWRGARLLGARNQVLLQDEIQASSGKTVWWFAHYAYPATTVELAPDGTAALLTQGADRLWCKILSGGGTFQIRDAVPLPTSPNPTNQNANTSFKKLAIQLAGVTNTTLAVWFVPLASGEEPPAAQPALTALSAWNLAAANDAPAAEDGNAYGDLSGYVDVDLRAYVTDDATPPEHMRFSVFDAANGTVALLPDGHTARFTPAAGYTGVPLFRFAATDAGPDARTLLVYDFEPPDPAATNSVADASGSGCDGTLESVGAGAATLQADVPPAFGRDGRSLDLAESGGANAARLFRVVASNELNFSAANWTISGWFKRRDATNEDMLWHLNNGDGFGTGEELYLIAHGANTLSLHHYPGPDVNITTNALATNVWYHAAVVRSGASMSLYLNGALVGTDSSFALAINQTNPVVFGGHTDSSAAYAPRWLDGRLDDLAIHKAALSPSEIAALADGLTVRHLGGLTSTGTITVAATPSVYTWTNALAGLALPWSEASNWSGNQTPAASRGAELRFFTGQPLPGGTVTSHNDLASAFTLNRLYLAGSASATETVTVTGGPLVFQNNGLAAPSLALDATGSALTYTFAAPMTLSDDLVADGAGTATFRISGPVSGPGGLVKAGNRTLTLTGTNTYAGATAVQEGTLQIGADGATGTLGAGPVENDGQLRFDRTGTLSVPNAISGAGSLFIDCPKNGGTVVLSGTNTFTGGVTINSGALRITGSAALGEGEKQIGLNNGSAGAPQLRLDGSAGAIDLPASITYKTSYDNGAIINEAGTNTLRGDVTITAGGGDTKITASAGLLTLTGALGPNTTSRTLQLSGAGAGELLGAVTNGGVNLLSVSKNDSGRWLLAGSNTFSGALSLNAGTLVLGHPCALGRGGLVYGANNGACTLSAGATLDLNGQADVTEILSVRGSGVGGAGALVNAAPEPASLAGGAVSVVTVTAGGFHSAPPEITFSGSGSNAAAVATLGLTAASFTISGGTAVYAAAPNVSISGGGGYGAAATAVLSNGVVSSLAVTSLGTGYATEPAIAFSGGTILTNGTAPSGVGNATHFAVSGIQLTTPGSGYSSAPAVTFGSGAGTLATASLASVSLGANTWVGGSGDLRIDAPISGSYALTKIGAGALTLAGTNTYSGATTVSNGTLVLRSSLAGGLTVATGACAPQGAPAVAGSLAVHAGGRLAFRLGGPLAGDDYDTLTVAGAVSLAGALDLEAAPGLPLASSFTLINSAGAGAVSGAFTNKPNNSAFTEDGYRWRITYAGGTGNDVVLALASLPTLSDLTNVTVAANTSAGPLAFTVGDAETAAEALTVTAASSNPALMPTNRIILGGAGANRTVTLSPASNQTGTATITLTVSDGLDTASDSFVLSVVAASVWTNAAAGAPLPWTQGANWLAGSPAFSHTNGALAFLPGQTLSPGALVATNDNPGTFQLATLRLAGDGPAGGAASVTLTGGPLALGNGAVAPALSLEAGAGAGGSLSYTVANALALARTVNITGDGSADFVLSGALQGAGGLAKSGAATLRLTGPNTFAGGLALADNAGVTAASLSLTQSGLGSGPVAIGAGATLQLDCSSTAAGTVSKTNAISGAGALQLSFSAGATPRATALPGLSGFAGEVQLTGAAGTGDKLDASGVLAPAAAVLVDSGHTLVVSNAPASFASLAVRGAGNAEGRGALRLASAAAALTAPLTLLADTTLAGDHPSATFAGPITGTAGTGATQTLAQGTAAAAAGCTISGALSDGPNGGRLALAQTRGTLTLAGASTYSGATTVSGGTLALGAHDALPVSGAVTLGTPAGAGALALGAFSQTLATLTIASTNSLLTNLVAGATGQALTLSGAGGLTVGTDSGTNSFTRCRMVGGGRLAVTNPAALVVVGKAQPTQNYANSGTLDLAGLSSVLLGAPDAPISELRVGYGLTATGWLALSDTSNSVAATTVQIGCSAGGNGGSSTLILGAGANVISANALSIGLSKSSGILKFASQAPSSPGTVTITGRTKPAADLTLGAKTGTGTAATPAGTLDLRGHAADVTAGALTIGKEDNNNTQYSGGATGALLFDGGAFTASNVVMAAKSAAGTGLATATLTVSGGVFTVVSGGALTLASQSGGGSASGTLNVLGGTFRTYADLRDGGGSATSTVNLNGGALDLSGRAVGAAAPRVDALLLRAGTLMNLGQFNGGEPLVKSGPGTLVLAGTNTYTGATVASNGVLRLAGPAVLPPAANLAILSGASVDLAYAGTQTVHTMTVNGTQKKEGVYGASRLAPYLTGTGFLRPLWPPSPRTLLLIW